jgi:hypothetical protein
VLYYANAAQGSRVEQSDFIQNFPLADWIKLSNLFEKHEVRRYTPKATLLYILAEHNTPHLIRIHPNNLSYFEVEEERYGLPLFAASATGSQEAVRTFIELEMDKHTTTSKFRDFYSQYRYKESKRAASESYFKFSNRRAILSFMAELKDELVWAFLLDIGKVVVGDTKDSGGRTPFSRAAGYGYDAVVDFFLETSKVDVDSRDNLRQIPLSWAARYGQKGVVKLLLAKDKVDVDSRDISSQTPLILAAENGHEAVIKLLLATGKVDTESRSYNGQTPLSCAARYGRKGVIKLLFATGKVASDSRENNSRTPL